ncbi:MAG: aminotransferase class V-fold PLP-dependent enzyme [Bacteriovoracaceae bacterium]|jgi:cysteine desulfurase|nr:aminotransferase class V-fold PLP-dependent enzyme [Bacteriovoracaceae bacterium]
MDKINRIFLDYNSTSPLAENIKNFLADGDFFNANPSSQHLAGKKVARKIKEATDFFFDYFGLSQKEFNLFYHSGASEGINTLLNLSKEDALIYLTTDHAVLHAIAEHLNKRGVKTIALPVNHAGQFSLESLANALKEISVSGDIWFNFTYMNNETGLILDLGLIQEIKKLGAIKVHVDAAQIVGKFKNFQQLANTADAYTFSGHKFGALKGCGLSFVKKSICVKPLILGGGQQNSIRSGTMNTTGILSMKLALEQMDSRELTLVKELKDKIIDELKTNSQIMIIENSSYNTLCLMHKTLKSDVLLVHFDMAGLDISIGSACASGTKEPSFVLHAMGYTDYADKTVRLSLGPGNLKQADVILERLKSINSHL